MFGEYGLAIGLTLGVAVILGIGSTFTPIVPRGEGQPAEAGFAEAAAQEYGYCARNLDDIDCGCFANRAGQVMTHNAPTIRGAETIDRTELARMQATDSC